MGQNDLFERLYGQPQPDPEEGREVEPHLKSRSGRSFLESLRNEQSTDFPASDTRSEQD